MVEFCQGRRGFGGSPSEHLLVDLQQNKILLMIKNFVYKYVDIFVEIAKKKDDCKKIFEQAWDP